MVAFRRLSFLSLLSFRWFPVLGLASSLVVVVLKERLLVLPVTFLLYSHNV